MKPYKLMSSLFAHTGDVKSLCSTRDNGGFVSVSRDLSAKLWNQNENSNQYSLSQTITVHKKYVNAVAVAYTLEEYPNGLIITGSNDQTIAIHNIESNELISQLHEHQGAVCTLNFNNDGNNLLYSGSFDCSVKVWNLNDLVKSDFKLKSMLTLKEHEHTVWAVLGIEKKGIFLTGSADKTIKQWNLNKSWHKAEYACKYVGHSDCVRSLALNNVNDNEFFSCSNDGSVINWKLGSGSPYKVIKVTESFLYSINMVHSSFNQDPDLCYFVTSGEDRTLRVHSLNNKSQANLVQSIALPCQTLWYVLGLPNGNLAVACSDGSIRLFTQNEQLMSSKAEQEEYERELSQFSIPIKANEQFSQINRTELPGVEALSIPGRKDGQTLMINNDNEIEVYQWDLSETKWVKIGVAVGSSDAGGGASGTRQKTSYLGKEYDYVFDIELDDSGRKLKLPYNINEDPYFAAQQFIHRHELDQGFLDQIAHFIIKNTQSETIAPTVTQTSTYYDPFTGQGRYVPPPTSSSNGNYNSTGVVDPFTGSGAYHTGMSTNSTNNYVASSTGVVDPFTGSGAYHTGLNQNNRQQAVVNNDHTSNEYYPHKNFLLFDQSNAELVIKKLREFQQQLAPNHQNELITDNNNIDLIDNLLSNYSDSMISQICDQIDLLFQMIEVWPIQNVFPLIDLLRILAMNKKIAIYLCRNQNPSYLITKQAQPNSNSYFNILFKLISQDNLVCSMLVAKVVCNLFNSLSGSEDLKTNQKVLSFLLNERQFIMNRFDSLISSGNKSFQIAFATLILNYVILFNKISNIKDKFSSDYMSETTNELIEYLNNSRLCENIDDWDNESIFRLMVSYGTLLSDRSSSVDHDFLISVAKSLANFKEACERINAKSDKYPEKVKLCSGYLNILLS